MEQGWSADPADDADLFEKSATEILALRSYLLDDLDCVWLDTALRQVRLDERGGASSIRVNFRRSGP